MLDWMWLRNSDNRFAYGHVITKQGFARYTVPPLAHVRKKASKEEENEAAAINAEYLEQLTAEKEEGDTKVYGLDQADMAYLDCLYFFEVVDFEGYCAVAKVKAQMREGTIMLCQDSEVETHKQAILDYNAGDVAEVLKLNTILTEAMVHVCEDSHVTLDNGVLSEVPLGERDVIAISNSLADWAARTAIYAYRGVPINRKRLDRLLKVTPELQKATMASWLKEHPEEPLYRVGLSEKMLSLRKSCLKESPYVKHSLQIDNASIQRMIENFCTESGIENWPCTRGGELSADKKTIEKYASGENIIKHYERHMGLLTTLKAFTEVKGVIPALEFIGSDNRQRPMFGPWGTQASRNAHRTKSLVPANGHVFRFLIDPPAGQAIVCCDFASQEIWIAACVGDDLMMKEAYKTEDFYMAFARYAGMYPPDLPIPTEEQRSEKWFEPHVNTRATCKTLCLAIGYGAGGRAVAAAVRAATKDPDISDGQGYAWVDEYRNMYAHYYSANEQMVDMYYNGSSLLLPNGWRLGFNNPSRLSTGNFAVQGRGAAILQQACKLIDEAGLQIIFTMHDEIACLCQDKDKENVGEIMVDLMKKAAANVLGEEGMKIGKPEIVTHGQWWNTHSKKATRAWVTFEPHFKDLQDKICT